MSAADSFPLEGAGPAPPAPPSATSPKLMVALFVLFMFITCDAFTSRVLPRFGRGTTRAGAATAKGAVIQALLLVFAYVLVAAAAKAGLI